MLLKQSQPKEDESGTTARKKEPQPGQVGRLGIPRVHGKKNVIQATRWRSLSG
jgi:hypothetical protein